MAAGSAKALGAKAIPTAAAAPANTDTSATGIIERLDIVFTVHSPSSSSPLYTSIPIGSAEIIGAGHRLEPG
ncbi:hypothetical protein [Mycolicibacterium alvei]|uniref:hypothetical protein n=1 Tax=Mycolicibacterium alvei TaxID=67081 RepID=UPI0031E34113